MATCWHFARLRQRATNGETSRWLSPDSGDRRSVRRAATSPFRRALLPEPGLNGREAAERASRAWSWLRCGLMHGTLCQPATTGDLPLRATAFMAQSQNFLDVMQRVSSAPRPPFEKKVADPQWRHDAPGTGLARPAQQIFFKSEP